MNELDRSGPAYAEAVDAYYATIVDLITGQAPRLRSIPFDRLDWEGVSAVLALYDQAAGGYRTAMIDAMGLIVEDGRQPAWIVAQVIDLATSLDLAQIQPSIDRLAKSPLASEEPVRGALGNYLTARRLLSGLRPPVALAVPSAAKT